MSSDLETSSRVASKADALLTMLQLQSFHPSFPLQLLLMMMWSFWLTLSMTRIRSVCSSQFILVKLSNPRAQRLLWETDGLWKRTGLVFHWEHLKDLLQSYNKSVSDARSFYFSKIIHQNKNNPTVLFNTVSSIVSLPAHHV